MAMWLYQMSEPKYSHKEYRLEIWENERWRWEANEGQGTPEAGDTVVFFFTKSGCDEPGFYGWAVILRWEETKTQTRIHFRTVAPSDQLKMHPWWDGDDGRVQQIVDEIRGGFKQYTRYEVRDPALVAEIAAGINAWVSRGSNR